MRIVAQPSERAAIGSAAGRYGRFLGRFAVTAIAVGVAAIIGWQLWIHYLGAPWTRDGRVRADVVQVAADVSGLVSNVSVHDNQAVKQGDVLFRIDPARFDLAPRDAQANVDSKLAAAQEAERETARYSRLTALSVSEEQQQQRSSTAAEAQAANRQRRTATIVVLEPHQTTQSTNGPGR